MSRGWKAADINDVPPMKDTFSKGWKSVRWHLGIKAFGVNACTKGKGEFLTPKHDEKNENQDELFVVMEGKVEFCLDGKSFIGTKGCLLSVEPQVRRSAKALESPTTILIVGSPIGKVYSPASWA